MVCSAATPTIDIGQANCTAQREAATMNVKNFLFFLIVLPPDFLHLFKVPLHFNTEYKYRELIGETVIAEDREDVSFIWFNEYDEESHLNDIDLKVFVQEEGDIYQKFQEEHIQRGYTLDEIKQLLEESGLIFLEAYEEYTMQAPQPDSGRIVVVAQEHGKNRRN